MSFDRAVLRYVVSDDEGVYHQTCCYFVMICEYVKLIARTLNG